MPCERYLNAIHELVDGTLGPIRRSELELHLESCDDCRAFAEDLQKIARAAGELGPIAPPPQVWARIAADLQREGRVQRASFGSSRRTSITMLALAAALVIAVGASLFLVTRTNETPVATNTQPSDAAAPSASANAGNVTADDAVKPPAERIKDAAAKVSEATDELRKAASGLPPGAGTELQKSLLVATGALEEAQSALQTNPEDAAAQQSYFRALKQKIRLLNDTIALMNEMRQGDAAGAAQIVEGGKS